MVTRNEQGIPMRPLGKTGVDVSALCLGGFHIGIPPEADGIRLIHSAIDNGITFLDNAWEYNNNESERRMGVALAQDGYRDKVFLMTKNCAHDRTAKDSMVKLEESLRRLQTDHLDLWQIHEVTWSDDPDRIFAPGGAAEAMLKAKEAGKTRFIGFTGHKSPSIFRRMLSQGFPWDTIQMPVSVLDANFNSFQREIIPLAQAQGIGIIGMKSLANGHLFEDPGVEITAAEARRYALSQPIASLCVGIDKFSVLDQDLRVAREFVPMTDEEQTAAIDKVFPSRLERRARTLQDLLRLRRGRGAQGARPAPADGSGRLNEGC
jgi:aryl-alcohol dehydrogenase-like predicted oxidoreductase